jgi:hypothetical protein
MSVKLSGPCVLTTAATPLLNNAPRASFSCRIRFDAASVAPVLGANLFGRSDGKGFAITVDKQWNNRAIRFSLMAQTGGAASGFSFNYVPGRAYHLAASWDATTSQQVFYLDGRVMATTAVSSALQAAAASSAIQIGSASHSAGTIYFIDDCYLWSGAVLTASDVQALLHRTAAPGSLYPGALVWGAALDGTDGATAAPGDSGLVDPAAGLSLTPSGGGSAAWSSDSLAFIPSIVTTAKVLKSGKSIAFFFTDSVTGQPAYPTAIGSNPTLSINGGAAVALSNPISTTPGNNLPFALYALPRPVSAADALTYSAAVGWASVPTPPSTAWPVTAADSADSAAVVNGVGLDNVAFPAPTMELGWNLADPDYYTCNQLSRNIIRTTSFANVTASDANFKPTAKNGAAWQVKIPSPTAANGIDSLRHVAPASVPWMPDNPGQYTVVWSEAAPGNDSGGYITAGSASRAVVTERTDLAENPTNGIRRKRVFEVARPANPADYTLGLFANFTRTDCTDLYVFGPGNAVDYAAFTDDVLKQYVAGSRVVRFMDTLETNGSPVATRDHLRPATDLTTSGPRPYWATVTAVNPVANIANYSYAQGWMAASFTTAAPHGFYTGQYPVLNGMLNDVGIPLTLTTNLTAADTHLSLADVNTIRINDFIVLGSEWMQVSRISGTDVTVARGAKGTTATAHANGDTGVCRCQGIIASDGVSHCSLSGSARAPIVVTSPTTFDALFYHGNPSLGSTTVNALSTTQTFDPANAVGFPSTSVGVSFDDCFKAASEMGVDAWICVPFAATDDCVRAIAEKAVAGLAAGLKVWVEFSNEIWNTGASFAGQSLGAALQGKLASPPQRGYEWGAVRAGQVHDVFAEVLDAAGRGGDLVRVIAFQWGNPAAAPAFLNFCAANSIRIDAYAIAPYRDFPAALAAAADGLDSDQLHDFWQLFLTSNYPADSALQGGRVPAHYAALKDTYHDAKLVCYEGGIEGLLASSMTNFVARTHDMAYHPRMYETYRAYLASLQNSGVSLYLHYEMTHTAGWGGFNGGWSAYYWHGQQWGYGDGSDGKANNLDCLATTKPATVQQDFQNVSVVGQAWKDWAAALPDQRVNAAPIAAPGVLATVSLSSDHSPEVTSLLGGTTIPLASATVNILWTAAAIAAPATLATPLPSADCFLPSATMGGVGANTSATVVTRFSANPNTLGYFKSAEPLASLAGRSITASLDSFTVSQPFATISQIVGVSLSVPAGPLRSEVEAAFSATVGDRFVSPPALTGDGQTGAASVDALTSISTDAFAAPWANAGILTPVDLGLGWSSDVGPAFGTGVLGGISFAIDFQIVAGSLAASGSLGASVGYAPAPSHLNDLEYFRSGEPEIGLAGKAPTAGFDVFRRGEPFRTAATVAAIPTVDSRADPAGLGAVGILNAADSNGAVVLAVGSNGAAGTLDAAAVAGSALAIAPTLPLWGMMNAASPLADVRLQAAGLGVSGAMGIPFLPTSIDASLTIHSLAGSGTFSGGRVRPRRIVKPYIFPRRSRGR